MVDSPLLPGLNRFWSKYKISTLWNHQCSIFKPLKNLVKEANRQEEVIYVTMQFPAVGNVIFIITASVTRDVLFKFPVNSGCWQSSRPPTVQLSFPNSTLCRADKSPPRYQDGNDFFTSATIVVTANNSVFLASSGKGLSREQMRRSSQRAAQFSHALPYKLASSSCYLSEILVLYYSLFWSYTCIARAVCSQKTPHILLSTKGSAFGVSGKAPSLEIS